MFYDTGIGKEGYSIIGQGQIDKILSGKPEDRRELFDEAAGNRKIQTKKKHHDQEAGRRTPESCPCDRYFERADQTAGTIGETVRDSKESILPSGKNLRHWMSIFSFWSTSRADRIWKNWSRNCRMRRENLTKLRKPMTAPRQNTSVWKKNWKL